MKIRQISLALLIAVAIFQIVHAQSGRTVESPTLMPENSSETVEKYPPCKSELETTIYISLQNIIKFTDELNRLGNCGYKLEHFSKLPLASEALPIKLNVFGVVKLDSGNRYEYNWFAASSAGQLQTNANKQAEAGFYYRQNVLFIAGRCSAAIEQKRTDNKDAIDLNVLLNLDIGSTGAMYIFERKNKVIKKREYKVLVGNDNDGKKSLPRNQKTLDDYVSRGFRPVADYYLGYFDVFAILMEKDEETKPEGNYLIIRQYLGVAKKLTKLAQTGYQPILIGTTGYAVLHRKNAEPLLISFKINSSSELAKKLPTWNGAHFLLNSVADNMQCDPFYGRLFFTVSLNTPQKKFDYRFLKMTDVVERITKKKEKNVSYTDLPTDEKLREFQKILGEGYEVRQVFYFGEIYVLFEKELNAAQIKF